MLSGQCTMLNTHCVNDNQLWVHVNHYHMEVLDLPSNTCLSNSERRALNPNGWGTGFTAHWGHIIFFCFHMVKPLIPILPLFPISATLWLLLSVVTLALLHHTGKTVSDILSDLGYRHPCSGALICEICFTFGTKNYKLYQECENYVNPYAAHLFFWSFRFLPSVTKVMLHNFYLLLPSVTKVLGTKVTQNFQKFANFF